MFHSLVSAAAVIESSVLRVDKVSRLHMGDYLCVASNGIAPSTSKKYRLRVQCKFGEIKCSWDYIVPEIV